MPIERMSMRRSFCILLVKFAYKIMFGFIPQKLEIRILINPGDTGEVVIRSSDSATIEVRKDI